MNKRAPSQPAYRNRQIHAPSTWGGEGGELVEELGVFLLAAHATHCANLEGKVPEPPACGQLANLQNVLDVVEIVDQQVALVHAGHKTCRWTWTVNALVVCPWGLLKLSTIKTLQTEVLSHCVSTVHTLAKLHFWLNVRENQCFIQTCVYVATCN